MLLTSISPRAYSGPSTTRETTFSAGAFSRTPSARALAGDAAPRAVGASDRGNIPEDADQDLEDTVAAAKGVAYDC
jgi:hypothetical protein